MDIKKEYLIQNRILFFRNILEDGGYFFLPDLEANISTSTEYITCRLRTL